MEINILKELAKQAFDWNSISEVCYCCETTAKYSIQIETGDKFLCEKHFNQWLEFYNQR